MFKFSIGKQGISGGSIKRGSSKEKCHKWEDFPCFLRAEISPYLIPETSEQGSDMCRTDFWKCKEIINKWIIVAFNNHVCIVVKPSAFFQIPVHGLFETGFFFPEFCCQLVNILVKVIYFVAVAEAHRIKGIKAVITERKDNIAIPGKFFEFIRHAEKTGSCVKSKTIFLQLVKSASCLAVLLNYFDFVAFLCKTQCCRQTSKTCSCYQYLFTHRFNYSFFLTVPDRVHF